jgi:hypothetical protein
MVPIYFRAAAVEIFGERVLENREKVGSAQDRRLSAHGSTS